MVGFAGLKTPYALFIIILMVLGIIAGAFYFYNASTQNPCGSPGPARFGSVYDTNIGQPYKAVDANFTGISQTISVAGAQFYTKAFDDPSQSHLINGICGIDPNTPASVTVQITITVTGQQWSLSIVYKGTAGTSQVFTPDSKAGLQWTGGPSLTLLVSPTA